MKYLLPDLGKLNSKFQISRQKDGGQANYKQITITEIQKFKQCLGLEGLAPVENLEVERLNIGICNLFVI